MRAKWARPTTSTKSARSIGGRLGKLSSSLPSQLLAWQPFSTPVLLFWIVTAIVLLVRMVGKVDSLYLYMAPLFCGLIISLLYSRQWQIIVDLSLCYLIMDGMLKIISNYHPLLHIGSDLLIIAATVFWLSSTKSRQDVWPPLTRLVVFYCLWIILMIFHPYAISLFASVAAFKVHLVLVVMVFLGYSQCRSIENVERSLLVVALLGTFVSVVGLLQYWSGSELLHSLSDVYRERDEILGGDFRPWSTTNTPGGISLGAFLATPCWLALMNLPNATRRQQTIYAFMIFIGLVALPFSQSRTMMAGVIGEILIFVIFCGTRMFKRAIVTLVLGVVMAGFSYFAATAIATSYEGDNQYAHVFYVEGRLQSLLQKDTYTSSIL
jgi:hypothetical protein